VRDSNLRDMLEIRDNGIDAQEVLSDILANMRARRERAGTRCVDLDAFVDSLYQDTAARFEPWTQYHLYGANAGYDKIAVSLSLTPPPKVPILGSLWQRVRVAVHNLIIFYVNMLAYRQIEFNKHILLAVNKVAEREEGEHLTADELDYMRQEITKLHEEVERLKERLAADNQRP